MREQSELSPASVEREYSPEPGTIGLQTVMRREEESPAIDRTVPTISTGSSADTTPPVPRGLERINRLPPLKRAIVLSEILSRPVGDR